MTLDEARGHLARHGEQARVVYQPSHGPAEEGVITSVSNQYIFVRYGSDAGSKATRPDWLAFVNGDTR